MHTSVSFLGRWLCLGPKMAPEPFTAGGVRALGPHGHCPPKQWHRADAGAGPQTLTCHRCPLRVPWAGGTHLTPTQDPRASPLPHPGQHGYPGEGRTATKVTAGTVKKTGHMVKGMAEVCVHMCGSAFRCVCAGMPDVCTVYVHTCVQACRGVHVCVHIPCTRSCEHPRSPVSTHPHVHTHIVHTCNAHMSTHPPHMPAHTSTHLYT